jgi:invasion protein IalB
MFKMLTVVGLALAICSGPALAAAAKSARKPAASAQRSTQQRPPATPLPAAQRPWSQACSWENPCVSRNLY